MVVAVDKRVCCTVVGDGLVGKTGLIQKFVRGDFIPEYVATLKDEYTTKLRANGDVYDLHVTDLAGEVSYFFEYLLDMSYMINSVDGFRYKS